MRGRSVALMLVMLTAAVPVMPANAEVDETTGIEFFRELDLETGIETSTVTFEGAEHFREINPGGDHWIEDAGIQFPEWLTLIGGNYKNNPSGTNTAFWNDRTNSKQVCFDDPVQQVSMFYASSGDVQVEALDRDGEVVASSTGSDNLDRPNRSFSNWDLIAVSAVTDEIACIVVHGTPGATGIDDLAFSRQVLLPVDIQVGAGNGHARLPPAGHGSVEVAILAADDIDPVAEVNTSTLTFGKTGDESSLQRCLQPRDVDRDGRDDLVCRFDMAETGLGPTDEEAVLKGARLDGFPIRGSDGIGFRTDSGGR